MRYFWKMTNDNAGQHTTLSMNDQKGASVQPVDSIGDPDNTNIYATGPPIGTNVASPPANIVPLPAGSEVSRLRSSEHRIGIRPMTTRDHTTLRMNDPDGASDQPAVVYEGIPDQLWNINKLELGYRRAEHERQDEDYKVAEAYEAAEASKATEATEANSGEEFKDAENEATWWPGQRQEQACINLPHVGTPWIISTTLTPTSTTSDRHLSAGPSSDVVPSSARS